MQSFLQRIVEHIWYQPKHWGRLLLLPLSLLYQLLFFLNKRKAIAKQQPAKLPILIVGNINIGGTGKTPLVIAIAKLLQKNNLKPCIISRGYTGESKQWPLLVTHQTEVRLCGDEAKLMFNHTKLPVITGANRVESIRFAQQHCDCNIIISDDGLQHYAMPRDIELIVVDGQRRFGNKLLLPAGPLREKVKRLESVDFIVCNGIAANDNEYAMRLLTKPLLPIKSSKIHFPPEVTEVVIMTGIGNPHRFINSVKTLGYTIIHHALFVDHHRFIAEDLNALRERFPKTAIIMTEKDAVKCENFNTDNFWYLPIHAQLSNDFNQRLLKLVLTCMNE
ncbi:MAG: tetraacyldisaccharide 4'-kinase [Thiotrichaceae bacterium]|nr:tetraacyldisaccharide 4'-kinase [Thiotrichaceae bacterium]